MPKRHLHFGHLRAAIEKLEWLTSAAATPIDHSAAQFEVSTARTLCDNDGGEILLERSDLKPAPRSMSAG